MAGIGVTGAAPGGGHAFGKKKVGVCHKTGGSGYLFKQLPTPALKGHVRHGDIVCDNPCLIASGCNVDGTCAGTIVADSTVVTGGTCCGGAAVDTQTDPANCGTCGVVCDSTVAAVCSNGACVAA